VRALPAKTGTAAAPSATETSATSGGQALKRPSGLPSGRIYPRILSSAASTSATSDCQAHEKPSRLPSDRVLSSGRIRLSPITPSESVISSAITNSTAKEGTTSAIRDSTTSDVQLVKPQSRVPYGRIRPPPPAPSEPVTPSATTNSANGGSTTIDAQVQESSNRILSPGLLSPFVSLVAAGSVEPSSTTSIGRKVSFPDGRTPSSPLRPSTLAAIRSTTTKPNGAFNEVKTACASQDPPKVLSQPAKKVTFASRLPATTIASPISPDHQGKATIDSGVPGNAVPPPISLVRRQKAALISDLLAANTTTPPPSLMHRENFTIVSGLPAATVAPPLSLIARERDTVFSGLPATTVAPPVSSAHHEKATGKPLRRSSAMLEDYEIVSDEAELDDEFDFLDSEGPSAANGKKK
jgi:hypothetical protein